VSSLVSSLDSPIPVYTKVKSSPIKGIVSIPLSVDYVQPETDWEKLGLKKNAEIIQKAETEGKSFIYIGHSLLTSNTIS
jgi:hypothetical protein